jgi:acyl-CoA reductase-like NAD-dependent aldehyde dehydrogenase
MSDNEREDILQKIHDHIIKAQQLLGDLMVQEGNSDESDAIREPLQSVNASLHHYLD